MSAKASNNNTFVVELLEKKREDLKKRSDFISWDAVDQLAKTTYLLGIFQVTLIILFATVGGSQILYPATAPGTGTQGYNMFIGVEIMMFVGFGYLMTFLKWYGLGAVGFKYAESREEGSITEFHDNNYWEVAEDYGTSERRDHRIHFPNDMDKEDIKEASTRTPLLASATQYHN